jgi:hypothetical protein
VELEKRRHSKIFIYLNSLPSRHARKQHAKCGRTDFAGPLLSVGRDPENLQRGGCTHPTDKLLDTIVLIEIGRQGQWEYKA